MEHLAVFISNRFLQLQDFFIGKNRKPFAYRHRIYKEIVFIDQVFIDQRTHKAGPP